MATLDELIAEQVKRARARQAEAPPAEAASEPEDVFAEVEPAAETPAEVAAAPEVAEEGEREPTTPHPSFEKEGTRPEEVPVVEEAPVAAAPVAAQPAAAPKDPLLADIESALQEDLEDLYKQLPPARQKQFRVRGEQAATSIRQLLVSAHANVKKIFQIIADWLKLIPGVNRFFLEQEAKIKTDKILAAAEEERRRGHLT